MKTFGYVRISTKDQKPDRQLDAFKERGIAENDIFIDRMSGNSFNRPEYQRLLKRARRGDLIVIKSIDRLGRNYKEILKQWRYITGDRGIDIEVMDFPLLNTSTEHYGLTGKLISDLFLQILAYVAETERTFIRQRQKEGIKAAQARGIHFGRTKITESESFFTAFDLWVSGKMTSREAAKISGMSHSTFYRRCRELKDQGKDCFKE